MVQENVAPIVPSDEKNISAKEKFRQLFMISIGIFLLPFCKFFKVTNGVVMRVLRTYPQDKW
jgi:hypothetical protein